MGCYMSQPDDRVYVTEGEGKNFTYATASCQGWRREQEDAEECLPFFDDDASLFILCDGHGGAEVAQYTVEHLPEFIKNHPLYKKGEYEQALERSFIEFDALLRTDKVMAELNRMAYDGGNDNNKQPNSEVANITETGTEMKEVLNFESSSAAASGSSDGPSSSKNGPSSIADDVDTETLRREAAVPLRDILDRYSSLKHVKGSHHLLSKFNASPVIKNTQTEKDQTEQGTSSAVKDEQSSSSLPSTSKSNGDEPVAGSSSDMSNEPEGSGAKGIERYFAENDSGSDDDSEYKGEDSSDDDGDDEDDEECDGDVLKILNRRLRRKKHKRPAPTCSSSEDNEDDENDDDEDDDDDEEEDDDDDDDDDDEDEEDEDDEEDSDEEENGDDEEMLDDSSDGLDEKFDVKAALKKTREIGSSFEHKAGTDSGCTVVVALIKGKKLYVASAGDSRAIMIMRKNGTCKPMSFDHKPESPTERKRIHLAGGRVIEGRVNGGLNLSRALGDFGYKHEGLDAKDQMITPCPDVNTADLDPEEVEYLFLACDGIWNSLNNGETTDYIKTVAPTVNNNLVDICLSLFRTCMASGTDGDGTGCDNMTCIIVRFDTSRNAVSVGDEDLKEEADKVRPIEASKRQSSIDVEPKTSQKRSTNDGSGEKPSKRKCIRLITKQ